jgi:hypothetical protein
MTSAHDVMHVLSVGNSPSRDGLRMGFSHSHTVSNSPTRIDVQPTLISGTSTQQTCSIDEL